MHLCLQAAAEGSNFVTEEETFYSFYQHLSIFSVSIWAVSESGMLSSLLLRDRLYSGWISFRVNCRENNFVLCTPCWYQAAASFVQSNSQLYQSLGSFCSSSASLYSHHLLVIFTDLITEFFGNKDFTCIHLITVWPCTVLIVCTFSLQWRKFTTKNCCCYSIKRA